MENNFEIKNQPADREAIIRNVEERRDYLYKKHAIEASDIVRRYVEKIRGKYPDYEDYELYHVLTGSGKDRDFEKFDFPGDDSVEKFARDTFDDFMRAELSL